MDRRTFITSLGGVGVASLGGCAGETTTEEAKSDLFSFALKVSDWVGSGESIGMVSGNEHWQVNVMDISGSGEINIQAVKMVFDETGQDKEGGQLSFTYDRNIQKRKVAKIENDFRVVFLERDGDRVLIGLGTDRLDQYDVNKAYKDSNSPQ